MKKALYTIGIIAIILITLSVCYFLITEANISKQKFSIENEKISDLKSEKCKNEFRKYYDYNNYDRSDFDEDYNGNTYWRDFYRVDDIRYSPESQSCIQFWYGANTMYEGNTVYEYKITDETKRTNIYYCSHSKTYSTNDKTKEECEDGYYKELKRLGINYSLQFQKEKEVIKEEKKSIEDIPSEEKISNSPETVADLNNAIDELLNTM